MGTAYKSILFVFFFLIPTLAVAQSPCTEQEMPGFIQLNQLEYLGFVMTGPAACVKASNQAAAVDWCGLSPRFGRAVNPANPQYGNKIDRGTLSYNPDEYYYCVKTSPPLENFKNANREVDESLIAQNMSQMVRLNDKRQLCNIANRLSPWLRKQPELRFVWSPKGEDGDCMCGVGGQRKLCDSEPPDSGAAELTQAPGPEQPVAVSVAAVEPANPTATSTPVDSSANVSAQLNTCAQEFIQDAQACKAESERAKNSCDQRINSNTGNDSSVVSLASGATQIMGQVFNMQNQASGMQAECFRAGAAANTATVAVNGMQERCEIDFSNCNRLCLGPGNESKVDEFKRVCAQRVNKTPEQIMTGLTTDNQPTADAQLFSSTVNAINQNIEDSSRICTVVATANKSKLSQLADGIGRALQSSVQCACQTSSRGKLNADRRLRLSTRHPGMERSNSARMWRDAHVAT